MTLKKNSILREQALSEILACGNDPIYFIERYCKIRHPSKGLVLFKLYDYQKTAIRSMVANDKLIVNKARQLGFTTLTAAFITWLILFHKDKEVLVVSINADVAKGMIEKVKVMLNYIPDWMYLANFKENRAHKISLDNGSSVESVARSDNAGRSKALALLVIDEAAIVKNMDEMWKGLKSTISTGGKVFALSTPKGIGSWFYKTWTEAISGENGWSTMLTNWWECPEYAYDLIEDPTAPGGKSSTWFREFTKDMTRLQISQELLTTFLETSESYFDSDTVKFCTENAKAPKTREGMDKNLWIWEEPNPGCKYLISADCSTGASDDYSAFHVTNLNEMKVVAEYKGKVYPDIFADILVETGKKYNNAWIAPENQQIGSAICFHIRDKDYPNLIYLNKEFKMIDKWTAQYQGTMPGVPNDVRNRGPMVAKLEEYLRKKLITVQSHRFVNEMHTFAVINGKPQAIKGENINDDLIMSLAIGVWVRDIIPEFNMSYRPVAPTQLINSIMISKKTYNHNQMTLEKRQDEIKKQLEEKGYTLQQPFLYLKRL